ncbi:MAG: hypothetical protein HDR49_06830 [Bacteroides sp.]|nr:hypothetical protein [Bacteroides sp.]
MRRVCILESLSDKYNFGKYKGLTLADSLELNPSYVEWCVKHCTGVDFILTDVAVEELRIAYPTFYMDNLFEERRKEKMDECVYYDDCDSDGYYDFEESQSYDRYLGSWAQDVEYYSDDDIDTIFDGDPSAYWNID